MKVGDYIVFSYLSDTVRKGKVELLGCVTNLQPLRVVLQPDNEMLAKTVELEKDQILAVLGTSPKSGSVFGVDTSNIYRCNKPIGKFGELAYYCKPQLEIRKAITTAFKIVGNKLAKNKLYFVFDARINYKVQILKGKMAGCYTHAKQGNHSICIDPSKCTVEDLPGVILHEISHHLFHHLTDEWVVKWAQLYANHIKPKVFTKEQCDELKQRLYNCESILDFKYELDDDDEKLLYRKCIAHVKSQLKVPTQTLQSLFELNKDTVLCLWPEAITEKHYESFISEYATKNYNETFAEAMSMYLLGKELPKKVNILCSKTLGAIKVLAR